MFESPAEIVYLFVWDQCIRAIQFNWQKAMKARPLATIPSSAGLCSDRAARAGSDRRVLVIGAIDGVVELGDAPDVRLETVEWTRFVPDMLANPAFDLIVPIVDASDRLSSSLFQCLSDWPQRVPVLAVLPAGDLESDQFREAVRVVDDFVLRPVRFEEWRQRLTRLAGEARCGPSAVVDALTRELGLQQLIGSAPNFVQVVNKIPIVARSGSPALITGETGTGKELCARAIHFLSPRRNQPFIPVDCGALPDNLFENELFGHVRGAFTDAHRDQRGLVSLAEGGTLFLDEVDSLSTAAQAKLLRFLQERSFRPLGSERFQRANVNVLAAMNREPEPLVRDKTFRSDLYFRLNVVRLHLVPLRERASDIPLLARHFVADFAAEAGLGPRTLSPAVVPRLLSYDWPGNVRELHNVLQRAVVLAPDRRILPEDVLLPAVASDHQASNQVELDGVSFRDARSQVLEEFERSYVTRLFEKHGGNVTRAAREARKDRRAFGRLLKKHGIRNSSGSE